METRRRILLSLAIVAGLGGVTPAAADAIAVAGNTGTFTFGGAAQVNVTGMTSSLFSHAADQRIIATFSSECGVNAPAGNTSAWIDVDLVVINGAGATVQVMSPTFGATDAFCASNGTLGIDGLETNSVTGFITVPIAAGAYRVAVRARLNGGATQGRFGERSLVVWR